MLSIQNLCKYYDKNKLREQYVLKDITLTFPDTGLVSIFGPSGCGKTTLLNMIAGLDTPTSGTITFNNENVTDSFRYENVGVIFQDFALIEDKTVEENIRIGYLDATDQALKDTLKALDIAKLKDRRVSMLSGGEKQRVSIARAIIKKPAYIVADEPTGNLDLKNRMRVMQILKSLSTHFLVILVSHDQDLVTEYSDRIITLSDGCITQDKILHKKEETQDYEIKKGKNRFNLYFYIKDTFKMKGKTNFIILLFMITLLLFITCISARLTGYMYRFTNTSNQYVTLHETVSLKVFEKLQGKGSFINEINVDFFTIPEEKQFQLGDSHVYIKNKPFVLYPYHDEQILFSKESIDKRNLPIYLTSSLAKDILKNGKVGSYDTNSNDHFISLKKFDITTQKDLLGSTITANYHNFEVIGIVESNVKAFLFDETYYALSNVPTPVTHFNFFPSSIYQKYNPNAPTVEVGKAHLLQSKSSPLFYSVIDLGWGQNSIYEIQERYEDEIHLSSSISINCILSDYDYYRLTGMNIFYTNDLSAIMDILNQNQVNYHVTAEVEYQLAKNITGLLFILFIFILSILLLFCLFFTLLDIKDYTNEQLEDIIVLRNMGITRKQVIQTYTIKIILKLLPSFVFGFVLSILVTLYLKTFNYQAYYSFQISPITLFISLLIGGGILVASIYLYLLKKFSSSAASLKTKYKL